MPHEYREAVDVMKENISGDLVASKLLDWLTFLTLNAVYSDNQKYLDEMAEFDRELLPIIFDHLSIEDAKLVVGRKRLGTLFYEVEIGEIDFTKFNLGVIPPRKVHIPYRRMIYDELLRQPNNAPKTWCSEVLKQIPKPIPN